MNRRSLKASGWVNFPINQSDWVSTNEGGMFVRLVVAPKDFSEEEWMRCCGGYNCFPYDESLIFDKKDEPEWPDTDIIPTEKFLEFQNQYNEYQNLKTKEVFPEIEFGGVRLSRDFLAVITIGSTGWSGYHEEKGVWHCTYEDLTSEGKTLFNSMQKLYPDCKVELLTFLDT
jgi:hypothetical protein